MKDHKRTHVENKRHFYDCQPCNISFKYETDHRRHIDEKHVVDVRVYCAQCSKGFNNKSNLIRHINTDHYEAEFPPMNLNRSGKYVPPVNYRRNPVNHNRRYDNDYNLNDNYHNNMRHHNENAGGYHSERVRQTLSSRSAPSRQSNRYGPGHGWNGTGRSYHGGAFSRKQEGYKSYYNAPRYEYEIPVYNPYSMLPPN